MKSTRMLAAFLAFVFAFCLIPIATPEASAADVQTKDTTERHAQKIVSVVYDNSISMNDMDKRQHYAHYALQMLTALLNPQDELYITPMNDADGNNVENLQMVKANVKSVDLSAEDRSAEIQSLLSSGWYKPVGTTPIESVSSTLEYLKAEKQLGKASGENKEYWFIVFTDGQFDGYASIESELKPALKQYPNLHIIYLALGQNITQIADAELKNSPNFTEHYSENSTELIDAMQKIANQLTGRCNTSKYTLDSTGKKITIRLEEIGFSLRKISVLLQNSNAFLKSAALNGKALALTQSVTIRPDGGLSMKNGYSAVIGESNGKTMTSGTLSLEFSEAVSAKDLVIMLEPSLLLEPVVEYETESGTWDMLANPYSIGTLEAGTNVRIYYRIVDAETGKTVSDDLVFGNTAAVKTLSHDGKNQETFSYEERGANTPAPFRLTVGSHTAVLNVTNEDTSKSNTEGGYTLYTSFNYSVKDDPNYFRVEADVKKLTSERYQYEVSFIVYSENLPLTKTELSAYDWECSSGDLPFAPSVTEENGIAVIKGIAAPEKFGEYRIALRATDKADRSRVAETTVSVRHYPDSLSLNNVGKTEISLTENEFRNSTERFSFALDMDGQKKPFDADDVVYTVVLDGVSDISSAAKTENGNLVIDLTHENLGGYIKTPRTSEITVTARIPDAGLEASASATFCLEPSQYLLIPFTKDGEALDRFALHKNTVAVYFEVQRDGITLTADELQALLDAGAFSLTTDLAKNKLSIAKTSLSVQTLNGTPVIQCLPTNNHPTFLYCWLTSMGILGSEKSFAADVYGAQASAMLPVATPSPLSYVWRIVSLLLIAYILAVIISWIKYTNYLPRGVFGYLQIKIDPTTGEANVTSLSLTNINRRFSDRIMFRRFFPGKVIQKQTVSAANKNVTLTPSGRNNIAVTFAQGDYPNAEIWKMSEESVLKKKNTAIAQTYFGGTYAGSNLNNLDFSYEAKEVSFIKGSSTQALNGLSHPICLKPAEHDGGTHHLIFFTKPPIK